MSSQSKTMIAREMRVAPNCSQDYIVL